MESPDSDWAPSPLPLPAPLRPSPAPPTSLREDCWSEDATGTLVEEWGECFLSANRGNLRQQQWQEVADAVNRRHGSSRTDVQCKNRIDTLKKRYKAEKARVLRSRNKSYVSPWPFFSTLDTLIGAQFPAKTANPSPPAPPEPKSPLFRLAAVPVRPRSQKRFAREYPPAPPLPDAGSMFLRRHCTPSDTDSEESRPRSSVGSRDRRTRRRKRGYSELAKAVKALGEVYERVERWKQRELVELEKQRMQFAEEMVEQKMRWFLEMQTCIRKSKKPRPTSLAG